MDKRVYTIGRAPSNNIVYNYMEVSSQHAIVERDSNGWFITDISTNGTSVNGKRIPKNFKVPIKAGDKIVLAGKVQLNWSQLGINKVKKPSNLLWLAVSLLLVGVLGYLYFPNTFNDMDLLSGGEMSFEEINAKYEKSIVLIYHSFLYKIDLPGEKDLYVSFNEQQGFNYDFNPSNLNPIEITGTGFFVGQKGKIVTNRHVVKPWSEQEEVLAQIKNSQVYRKILELSSRSQTAFTPTIEGVSNKLGVAVNLKKFDGQSSIINCNMLFADDRKEVDIAVIQTDKKRVPSAATFIPNSKINFDGPTEKGAEACIIGFPSGFAVAHTGKIIEATINSGIISQVSDTYKIQYDISTGPGASGSPVFNKKGEVIAVNFSGLPMYPGLMNYGVKTAYLKDHLD